MTEGNQNPLRLRAWEHHENGRLQQAEGLYRELIDSNVLEYDISNLGALLRAQGRTIEALKLYEEWIPTYSNSLNILINATNCAIETENVERQALGK